MNSTGEAFIWGENDGLVSRAAALFDFSRSWSPFIEEQRAWFVEQGHKAWVANLNPPREGVIPAVLRGLLEAYYGQSTRALGVRRWGFKEVRHAAEEATLLLEAYPNGRIIFLVRHLRDVMASNVATGWLTEVGGLGAVVDQWVRSCGSMGSLSDPRVAIIRYEDLIAAPDETTEVIAAHLSIPRHKFCADVLSARNPGAVSIASAEGAPDIGELPERVQETLRRFY